jgi:hypothetical protein
VDDVPSYEAGLLFQGSNLHVGLESSAIRFVIYAAEINIVTEDSDSHGRERQH